MPIVLPVCKERTLGHSWNSTAPFSFAISQPLMSHSPMKNFDASTGVKAMCTSRIKAKVSHSTNPDKRADDTGSQHDTPGCMGTSQRSNALCVLTLNPRSLEPLSPVYLSPLEHTPDTTSRGADSPFEPWRISTSTRSCTSRHQSSIVQLSPRHHRL